MRGGLRGRFVLMLGGEILQSAFHFGLNVGLVHTLSQADYGVFAIIFLVGGLCLTYVRSLAGVPASTLVPRRHGRRAARAYEVTFGSGAVALSVLMGAGVALALTVLSGANPLGGGAFVLLWCLRSYLRLALFAKRCPVEAGLGDLAFALSGSVLAPLLVGGAGLARVDGVFIALACAHALGIVASLLTLREPVRITFGRATRRRYLSLREQLTWSLVGVTTTNFQGQGQTLLVALFAGPEAYAPIAASLVLFAPLRLSVGAMLNMVQPEMAAHLATGGASQTRRLVKISSALIFAGSLAYGLLLLVAFPFIRSHIFGGRFVGEPLELITGLLWTVAAVSLGYGAPRILLEALGEFRFLAIISAVAAIMGAAVAASLLLVSSPAWSILGLILSEAIVFVACVVVASRHLSPPRVREVAGIAGAA